MTIHASIHWIVILWCLPCVDTSRFQYDLLVDDLISDLSSGGHFGIVANDTEIADSHGTKFVVQGECLYVGLTKLGYQKDTYLCPVLVGGAEDGEAGDVCIQLRRSSTGKKGDYDDDSPTIAVSVRKLGVKVASVLLGKNALELTRYSLGDGLLAPGTGLCMFMHQLFLPPLAGSSAELLQLWGDGLPGVTEFLRGILHNYVGSVGDLLSFIEPYVCLNLDSSVRRGSYCIVLSPGIGFTGMLFPKFLRTGIEKPRIIFCSEQADMKGAIAESSLEGELHLVQNGRTSNNDDIARSVKYVRMSKFSLRHLNNYEHYHSKPCRLQQYKGADQPCQKCEDPTMNLTTCTRIAMGLVPSKVAFDGIQDNCDICKSVVKILVKSYLELSEKYDAEELWLGDIPSGDRGMCNFRKTNCAHKDDSRMCAWRRGKIVNVDDCVDLCEGLELEKCKDIAHRLVGRYRVQTNGSSLVFWTPRETEICLLRREGHEEPVRRPCQLYKVVIYRYLELLRETPPTANPESAVNLVATQICAELGSLKRGRLGRVGGAIGIGPYPCF